ncbi:MAG: hypothetical protein ACOCYC_00705 [bacterium]
MEQILGRIELGTSDRETNDLLRDAEAKPVPYTRHYSQGEDFFIRLDRTVEVPHLPIHHDVRSTRPTKSYIEPLRSFLSQVVPALAEVFSELTYFFDPGEIMRPAFFRLYKVEDTTYLYLLRLDLHYNPNLFEVIDNGSNDVAPAFRTDRLFMDADLIPIERILYRDNAISGFEVEQLVSQTWIGETGRGYFVQGIWLDRELTKFFSKLFLPKGRRFYPYYPFTCKYRSICHTVVDLTSQGRKALLPLLHRVRGFLLPHMDEIQDALRQTTFSEELPEFERLWNQVPPRWRETFNNLRVRPYLNEADMKEFILEDAESDA